MYHFVKRPDTVGEVGRPGPSPAQMWDKGPESWVRAGLPGLASHEQIANTDFANSVRPDAVGEVGVGCLFAAVMALVDVSLPVLDACRAMSG